MSPRLVVISHLLNYVLAPSVVLATRVPARRVCSAPVNTRVRPVVEFMHVKRRMQYSLLCLPFWLQTTPLYRHIFLLSTIVFARQQRVILIVARARFLIQALEISSLAIPHHHIFIY